LARFKVLVATTFGGPGGIGKSVSVFLKYIDKGIFQPRICVINDPGGPSWDEIIRMGYDLPSANGDKEELKRIIEAENPDIVHIHERGWETIAIEAAREARVPVIIETNTFGVPLSCNIDESFHRHIFISMMSAERYMRLLGINFQDFWRHCRVIYYPVDMERFRPNERPILVSTKPTIGRIARKDETKWNDGIVVALSQVIRMMPTTKCFLVGVPDRVKGRLAKLGDRIVILDSVVDTPGFYEDVDVMLHATTVGETFGYVIAEPMAMGKPVVTLSTPHMDNAQVELVDNGVNGFVVSSPDSMAKAIVRLLSEPALRHRMGIMPLIKWKRGLRPR
jgi:glycosyltransferase involved in cell wall biosynthesis